MEVPEPAHRSSRPDGLSDGATDGAVVVFADTPANETGTSSGLLHCAGGQMLTKFVDPATDRTDELPADPLARTMTFQTITDPTRTERMIRALSDPACREILARLDEPKTAHSLVDSCDVSSSTLYRKLEALTESGLVEEEIGIDPDYSHSTRYKVAFDELTISLDDVRRIARRVDDRND